MHERVTETGRLYYRTRGAVRFAAADRLARRDAALHEIDRGVTRIGDNPEHARVFGGDLVARECDPGEIGVDAVGRSLFGPQVEQDEVAAANCAVVFRGRTIMRIGAVLVDGDDRRRVRHQTLRAESRHHRILHGYFANRAPGRDELRYLAEGLVDDRSKDASRALMAGQLLGGQRSLEALDEICGGDDLYAHRTDDFDFACVDPRHVRNRASRRIVHRDSPRAAECGAQRREHLVMRAIHYFFGAERVEPTGLDGGHYCPPP